MSDEDGSFVDRWAFYHKDDDYQEYMDDLDEGVVQEDSDSYCPSPSEIWERVQFLNIMKLHGLSNGFIHDAMRDIISYHDVMWHIEWNFSPKTIEKRLRWHRGIPSQEEQD